MTVPLNTVRRIEGLDILLIDSTVAGAPRGELDAATLAWLDGPLGASTTWPAFHHPRFDTGIAHTDAVRLRNADALATVPQTTPTRVAGRGRACSSLGANRVRGHFGQHLSGGRAGSHTRIRTALAGSFQNRASSLSPACMASGPEFGSVVTHLVPVGEFPGPYSYGYAETTPPPL